MKNTFVSSFFFCLIACGTAYDEGAPIKTQASTATVTTKAEASTTTVVSTSVSGSGVTRHLPGTLVTTATGKYYYLVMSNGTLAPFASSALVTSSGYKLTQAIIVTTDELACYGRSDQIVTAMSAPPAGTLRDGTLVKEKGRSAVYVVSDGVAWPVVSQSAFDLAGYNLANVVEIVAGNLAPAVSAIGDCVMGVACLDTSYQFGCAKDDTIDPITVTGQTETATATKTATTTTTVSSVTITPTQTAGAGVVRHLPGTVIVNSSGKYYLVNDDDTISPFASASLVSASGYKDNMVISVSSAEFACYGLGDPITSALPAPLAGMLRDGMLVKEIGRSDTYIVSGSVAWPVKNEAAFYGAGYTFDAVKQISAGSLANAVAEIGDCVSGLFCLDTVYLYTCAIENEPVITGTLTATATATKTQSQTSVQTQSQTQTKTQTNVQPTLTETETDTTTYVTIATVNTATSTVTATATISSTVTATNTATATATNTVTTIQTGTASGTVTVTKTQTPTTIDLSWVYAADGTKLCLNAAYFAGGNKAVLLIWSGPGADAAKGPVTMQSGDRFCWDFMNREKGLYYFWADVPDGTCTNDTCARDAIPGNGAMYMTAPKATAAAHKWLHCETTGCDGAAYWDGSTLTPMGD